MALQQVRQAKIGKVLNRHKFQPEIPIGAFAYMVLTRKTGAITEIAEVADVTGGSDGTRTRGLCRDRAAL
jgi:hypothetical protein